jgi:hypothetical protein
MNSRGSSYEPGQGSHARAVSWRVSWRVAWRVSWRPGPILRHRHVPAVPVVRTTTQFRRSRLIRTRRTLFRTSWRQNAYSAERSIGGHRAPPRTPGRPAQAPSRRRRKTSRCSPAPPAPTLERLSTPLTLALAALVSARQLSDVKRQACGGDLAVWRRARSTAPIRKQRDPRGGQRSFGGKDRICAGSGAEPCRRWCLVWPAVGGARQTFRLAAGGMAMTSWRCMWVELMRHLLSIAGMERAEVGEVLGWRQVGGWWWLAASRSPTVDRDNCAYRPTRCCPLVIGFRLSTSPTRPSTGREASHASRVGP